MQCERRDCDQRLFFTLSEGENLCYDQEEAPCYDQEEEAPYYDQEEEEAP